MPGSARFGVENTHWKPYQEVLALQALLRMVLSRMRNMGVSCVVYICK